MTDPSAETQRSDQPPAPPPVAPGERRLAHPPSDRYRTPAVEPPGPPATSSTRGGVFAIVAGLGGAALITVLGGVLALSAGLLVAAAVIGWAVAVGLRAGAGDRIPPGRRVRLAIGVALVAVALGQFGLWRYALLEGGVLGPLDYLAQAFGPLVPLEFVAAWTLAWITAR